MNKTVSDDVVGQIASAYVANNTTKLDEMAKLIQEIIKGFEPLADEDDADAYSYANPPSASKGLPVRQLTPAEVRRSITDELLFSFEDGKGYKTLKRHLSLNGMTPEQYRAKWGLRPDYPMVAPSYSAARSALAKSMGLGIKANR